MKYKYFFGTKQQQQQQQKTTITSTVCITDLEEPRLVKIC